MSEGSAAGAPLRTLGVVLASLVLFAWAWAPAFPAETSLGQAGSLIGGRGSSDHVAMVWLRAAELARLGLTALALVLWAPRATERGEPTPGLCALAASLLAAAWADLAWGGWPPPQGIAPPVKILLSAGLAGAAVHAAARFDRRAGWGCTLLLLAGLGQQLARPAVELEALRSLERLALGDLTRSLVPLGAVLALLFGAALARGPLRRTAAAAVVALTAGGLWGLALWALVGPRRLTWGLLPLALAAEALSAQVAGWGRLAPGIPGGLAAGAALLGSALLGLGRERVAPATGS